MEENKVSINVLDEIFGALDSIIADDNVDGIKILGSILALPDESFDAVKGLLCESIEEAFNDTDARIAFAQMLNQNGVHLEDFTNNLDELTRAVDEMAGNGVEISESKKDFIKFIFITFINSMQDAKAISNRIIQIPIELCRDGAKLPTYATDGSAAMDIYSPDEYTINPGETVLIKTGLKVNIPKGYALLIQPRSGKSLKTKLRIPNTPGLIDSDYHEEIGVMIENVEAPIKDFDPDDKNTDYGKLYGSSYTIEKGERCAQMRLIEVPVVNWLPVSSLGNFEDNHGAGFGSTGVK